MKTPYQEAVERMGKETVDKLSRGAVDPETGYIARHLNAAREPPGGDKRCDRCGGYAIWSPSKLDVALCARCFDEWDEVGSGFLRKHGYVWSQKKWLAAFREFCKTKPRKVDVKAHNQSVLAEAQAIRTLCPEYFG